MALAYICCLKCGQQYDPATSVAGLCPSCRGRRPSSASKTVVRRYPVAHHVSEPRRCARCAARVFSYSTKQTTVGNKTVDEKHYCPPCDRAEQAGAL